MKALDASHLLIILSAQETRSLGLDLDGLGWESLHCRLAIARIFAAACANTDFGKNKNRIAIKAMQTIDGECVLMFSAISAAKSAKNGGRKIYRIKSPAGPYIYCFKSVSDLMDAVELLYRCNPSGWNSKLVLYDDTYRLVLSPHFSLRHSADCTLREYGFLCGKGKAAEAFLLEHGKLLSDNIVCSLGFHLAKPHTC